MRSVNESFNTNGNGHWSSVSKEVRVVGIDVNICRAEEDDEEDFGELRVYFDTKTWNIEEDGLIYTDKGFLVELKDYLARAGYDTDVEYSEQGMQGDNYVSLDVRESFVKSWEK